MKQRHQRANKRLGFDVDKRWLSADTTAQARIDALLVQMARRSAVAMRLKGGDPSIFGRL